MLVEEVKEPEFIQAMSEYRPGNFSYEGLKALYDFLDNPMDDDLELDVADLAWKYTEYSNIAEFQEENGDQYQTLDDIERRTVVIPIDGYEGFLVEDI
jgi:hypothetical protein